MKKLLLMLLGVLVTLPALARDFTYTYEGQTLTYTVIDEDAKTCKTKAGRPDLACAGNSVRGNLILPSNPKDGEVEYTLIGIAELGFYELNYLTSVDIPNSVTSIGDQAFSGCPSLTSIEMPNSVISIGDRAFYGCTSLTSIDIPNSVTSIGNRAFYGCTSLASIDIPNSVTSIGQSTFEQCTRLTSIDIPNSVTSIGDGAFNGCTSLTSIDIPNSVTSIGNYAFASCSSLPSIIIPTSVTSLGYSIFSGCNMIKAAFPDDLNLGFIASAIYPYPRENAIIEDGFVYGQNKSILIYASPSLNGEYTIDGSVKTIDEYAFAYCKDLKTVTIPNSVTEIGIYAFYECKGLTSVTISDSVTSIGGYAFSDCRALTSITVPNSVTSIGYYAFNNCSGLTSATIGNSVTYIGDYAFNKCSGLTSVSLGNSVDLIGDNAFRNCTNLTLIKISNIIPPKFYDNSFDGLYDNAILSVPSEASSTYLASHWSIFKNIRPGETESLIYTYDDGVLLYRLDPVSKSAFVIGANTSELSIPDRVTDLTDETNPLRYQVIGIGYEAFEGKYIKSIKFNQRCAIDIIGQYAFYGANIESIELPQSVTRIGDYAFSASRLKNFVVPESTTYLGQYAFSECQSLESVTFNTNLSEISPYAFYNCTNLYKASLSEGLKTIGASAFEGASWIRSLKFPSSLTSIGDRAFKSLPELFELELNEGLETIGEQAFYRSRVGQYIPYDGVNGFVMPASVRSIGKGAFSGYNAQYVDTPDLAAWCNIDFGDSSANPISSLTTFKINGEEPVDLVLPDGLSEVKPYCFNYCKSLKSIDIPNTVTLIGKSAFAVCSGLSTLVIPNSVASIGSHAFNSCHLTSLTIGSNLQSLNFEDFYPVTSLTIVDGLNPIELKAPEYSTYTLNELKIGREFTIDWNTGNKFPDLTNLLIGNHVTSIPKNAFESSAKLSNVKLGSSVAEIGDAAFSKCALEEIVLPPSVETIGENAFQGNGGQSIIMGANVKTIGGNAFDGCGANTVSITAPIPPTAPNTAFSNYTGKLYLQGQQAIDDYYNAYTCWDRFDSYAMIEPTELKLDGEKKFSGKPGDTFQLTASLLPADVTLPQLFYRSTNPEIASVDHQGLVTINSDLDEAMATAEGDSNGARSCKIIVESLYANGPVAEVEITDNSAGIDDIVIDEIDNGQIDFNAPVEVYNLSGVRVGTSVENLASGLYIVRQGNLTKKVAVK